MTSISPKFPLGSQAAIFWLIAFASSFSWMQSFGPEFLILTLSSLFIATVLGDAEGIPARTWQVPSSPVLICGALFWALSFISVATSDILFTSWISFFHLSALPMTILFFMVGPDPQSRFRIAWAGVRVVLAALAVYALTQYFFMPRMLTHIGRVHLPFRDPNSLAAVLSLGLFLVAGSFLRKENKFKWADAVLLLLLAGAFWTAGSRGAVLSMVVMGGVCLAIIGPRAISKRNWLVFAGVAGVTLLLTGLITPKLDSGPLRVLSHSLVQAWQSAIGDRIGIWSSALQILKSHLWFGTGIGTFEYYYPAVRSISDTTYGYMAHNEPLQFATEMGVLAPALFYGVVVLGIARTVSVLKHIPRGDDRRLEIAIPFCALGALVLHSHLTFNFHILPCLFLAGLAFALWHYQTGLARHDVPRLIRSPRFLNKTGMESLFLILCFTMITLVAGPLYSQRLVQDAASDIRNSDLHGFAEKVNLSDTLSLGTNSQSYSLAVMMPLGVLAQDIKPVTPEDREKFIKQAETLIAKGLAANPLNVDLMIQNATLSQLKGDDLEAQSILRRALAVDPLSIESRMGLADQLDRSGRLKEAVEVLNAGLDFQYGPERAQSYMEYFLKTMTLQEKLEGPVRSKTKPAAVPRNSQDH